MIDRRLFEENERNTHSAEHVRTIQLDEFFCEAGGHIPQVQVAFETWGTLNRDRSNAILICHALTGDSHAIGWWQSLVGPRKPFDTDRYFVICSNVLGGCQGTTGPSSPIPGLTSHYGSLFPIVTVGDMVKVQRRLVETLGIDSLYCVAGGSMGAMQALEWTVQAPGQVRKAYVTAGAGAHTAMQIGFNEAARQAIMRDPKWQGGDYSLEDPPTGGLAVARMIGHLTFLSETAFAQKFGRRLQGKDTPDYRLGVEFEVESYLLHQGEKFTRRFDANSLIYLTRAVDYYQLQSLERSESRYLFTSYTSDWIYPSHQSQALLEMALQAGCPAQHLVIDLPHGHDAFLLDGVCQAQAIARFLE